MELQIETLALTNVSGNCDCDYNCNSKLSLTGINVFQTYFKPLFS